MLARAFDADTPARWVVADSFSGRSGAFRRWLEEHGRAYAVMIPQTNAIQYEGQRIRVEQLAARLTVPESSPWLCLALSEECAAGIGRWLLIRRDADDPDEDVYWLAYGPAGTSEEELVRVCDARWRIEECFAQAKGEVGMDQYEVRTWTAWHRFVTLCLLAHASLVVLRSVARQEEREEKGALLPA
jgi:SRSO17 transposase